MSGGGGVASPSRWATQQLCHQLVDDSEFCVYDGPICATEDGVIAVAVDTSSVGDAPSVEHAETLGRAWGLGVKQRVGGDSGWDFRSFEFVSPRNVLPRGKPDDDGGRRFVAPAFSDNDAAAGDVLPFSTLPVDKRQWGPLGVLRYEMAAHPAAAIAAATTAEDAALLGEEWAATRAATAAAAGIWAAVNPSGWGDAVRPPDSVTWLRGAMYVSDLCVLCFKHPWHAAIAWAQLWALRRMNATGPLHAAPTTPIAGGGDDSIAPSAPPFRYDASSGLSFPPIDVFYVMGRTPSPTGPHPTNVSSLSEWNRELLRLWLPASAQLWMHDRMEEERRRGEAAARARAAASRDATGSVKATHSHWVCAPSGVILSEKPAVFTGVRDAHAFRVAAYARAGVDVAAAWRARPPHTITLVQRRNSQRVMRRFINGAAVEAILRATGLPVTVVPDAAELSWAAQVALFAGTGILVAAHGGMLANVMFLPVHAAVIEVHPYPLTVPVYGRLMSACRVNHYPLKGLRRPSAAAFAAMAHSYVNTTAFNDECGNFSTLDIGLNSRCNPHGKLSDIEVPLPQFRDALDAALDDIGCRGGVCRVDGADENSARFVRVRERGLQYEYTMVT